MSNTIVIPEESEEFYKNLFVDNEDVPDEEYETDTDDCLEEALQGEGILS